MHSDAQISESVPITDPNTFLPIFQRCFVCYPPVTLYELHLCWFVGACLCLQCVLAVWRQQIRWQSSYRAEPTYPKPAQTSGVTTFWLLPKYAFIFMSFSKQTASSQFLPSLCLHPSIYHPLLTISSAASPRFSSLLPLYLLASSHFVRECKYFPAISV